jgi:hypothetical protein
VISTPILAVFLVLVEVEVEIGGSIDGRVWLQGEVGDRNLCE